MNADTPRQGLRLLAMLIVADIRSGSPALAEAPSESGDETPRRGRKPSQVVAVASHHPIARAA